MSFLTSMPSIQDNVRIKAFLLLAALAALIVAPFFIYPMFLMNILCFALFASAFNFLLGYVGLLSFGHAAFFGSAAFVTAYAARSWGLPTELAILSGVGAAALLGMIIGFIAIRRQGIYFAMITLALGQVVYFFFQQASFTHGEDGIQNVPRGSLLGLLDLNHNLSMYFFVLGVVVIGHLFIWLIVNSPFGNILKAIRDNEARAVSLGYNVNSYKVRAFVISAALAGLAGSLSTMVFQLATLAGVEWQNSGEAILMSLVGGIGTLAGPAVGATVIIGLRTFLATMDVPTTFIIGFIFVACVILFRRGIAGEIIAGMRWDKPRA